MADGNAKQVGHHDQPTALWPAEFTSFRRVRAPRLLRSLLRVHTELLRLRESRSREPRSCEERSLRRVEDP